MMHSREAAPPSKSARKRAHQALQALGEVLMALSASELERVPLTAELRERVAEGRRLTKSARSRHVRLLGKLLSRAPVEPIEEAVAALKGASRKETARLHRVERWRARLLEEGDEALSELATEYPSVDLRRLRGLLRSARRERERGAPPRHFRELLRYLRALDEALDGDGT